MNKALIPFIYCLTFGLMTYAQQTFCETQKDDLWETEDFQNKLESVSNSSKTTYNVPVVFHIVHQGGDENVSDAVVNDWIAELNQQFANSGPYQTSDGVDIDINFCLAEKDTNGLLTTGITRDYSEFSHMFSYMNNNGLPTTTNLMDSVCRLYHWNTNDYFNVYLVKNLMNGGFGAGGVGHYPGNHGNYLDGVFLCYNYMNSADTFYYYPGLFSHEVGHYLGLYHTFDGGCLNNDCTTDNDKVCDTPPDMSSVKVCEVNNSCSTDEDDPSTNNPFRATSLGGAGDQMDDHTNYMDYTSCPSHFTLGQKNRMIAALQSIRASLLSSDACGTSTNGLTETNTQSEILVFPNPFFDQITIPFGEYKTCEFTLFNCTGSIVNSNVISEKEPSIELTGLSDGVYFYKLNFDSNSRTINGKLIKK